MEVISKQPSAPSQKDALVDVPSHKLAGGVGAVVGGIAAGAVVGTVAGPIGTVLGALGGAIAGGLGADALANSVNEVREEAHWRENYRSRPYVAADARYDDYAPAYQVGVVAFSRFPDQDYDDLAAQLSAQWDSARGDSTLEWDVADQAARDAWNRLASIRAADNELR